jgi:hypothetical protein
MIYELPGLDEWLERQCEGYFDEEEQESILTLLMDVESYDDYILEVPL